MTSWIQYHNCDLLGHYPSGLLLDIADTEAINIPHKERGGIYTKKRKASYDSVGNEIFLIIGIGKPKKYYLWSKILVDKVTPKDDGYFIVEGNSIYSQHPIRIDTFIDFSDFRHFCGNFGIGFQNITKHLFSETLGSLIIDGLTEKSLDDYVDFQNDSDNLIHSLNEKMKGIHPSKINKIIETTLRHDSKIVNLIKYINNYECQFPNCNTRIPKKDGSFYIEVAHIKSVAQGGQSVIGNLLVLCPNHHKFFDYGDLKIIEQTEHVLKGFLNNEEFEIKINTAQNTRYSQ